MNYLERATTALRSLGISYPSVTAPVLALLDPVAKYDNARVTSIATTLQQSSTFNEVIRDQIAGMEIAGRFAGITEAFDSIRVDAQQMAEWMADGRMDLSEQIKHGWMKFRRGSLPTRFAEIRQDFLAVAETARQQIEREGAILEAYVDFRMALKTAETDAQVVLSIAEKAVHERRLELESASVRVSGHTGDAATLSQLELHRDEALRALQSEDKSYQLIKDIADDLKTAYNTAELLFARLQQTHDIKERLYKRSITFFATNEVVFSGLSASFTSMQGLGDATNTLEAMKDGMNKSLEALATTGNQQLERSLRGAYGSTLKATSVKALADAVVDFQASSLKLIEELRTESTTAAREIEAATEASKQRFAALLSNGGQ